MTLGRVGGPGRVREGALPAARCIYRETLRAEGSARARFGCNVWFWKDERTPVCCGCGGGRGGEQGRVLSLPLRGVGRGRRGGWRLARLVVVCGSVSGSWSGSRSLSGSRRRRRRSRSRRRHRRLVCRLELWRGRLWSCDRWGYELHGRAGVYDGSAAGHAWRVAQPGGREVVKARLGRGRDWLWGEDAVSAVSAGERVEGRDCAAGDGRRRPGGDGGGCVVLDGCVGVVVDGCVGACLWRGGRERCARGRG